MRKLAIWLNWKNKWSEYHCSQLAAAISDHYDTTITYAPLDWSEFDLVYCFFPGPNRNPDCSPEKVIKSIWEPHEFGWAKKGSTVIVSTSHLNKKLRRKYGDRLHYLRWGINPSHYNTQELPETSPLVAGWAGNCRNPRKRVEHVFWAVDDAGWQFYPSLTYLQSGNLIAKRESDEMAEYYRDIHLYTCGSYSEGFHFPFLEAAACGRGIVTLNVGCAQDLRDSSAGVLIVKDFEEMKEKLRECDVEAVKSLGAQSSSAVRDWYWEKVAPEWLEVLDGIG